MAKAKYFHVVESTTGNEHLVKAPRKSLVLQLVTGGRAGVNLASDEDITAHLTGGGTLHEKSKPEGEGKLFLVAGERPSLIRAKNAGEAFSLVNDGTYEVKPATQDTLVRLLSAGLKVVEYQEPAPKKTDGESESETDADTTTQVAGEHAANDDAGGAAGEQAVDQNASSQDAPSADQQESALPAAAEHDAA